MTQDGRGFEFLVDFEQDTVGEVQERFRELLGISGRGGRLVLDENLTWPNKYLSWYDLEDGDRFEYVEEVRGGIAHYPTLLSEG